MIIPKDHNSIRPAFSYYGGKIRLAPRLVKLAPEHKLYVEGFGGSGALLLAKPESEIEIFNDIDSGIINFYRVLRDPAKFKHLVVFLELMPFSREEFHFGREHWENQPTDVERAGYWFIAARWAFSGSLMNSGWSKTGKVLPNHSVIFINAIHRLPEIHARLRKVQIDNCPYEVLIKSHDTRETFFYFDPPYVPDTRTQSSLKSYKHEMSYQDHERFIEHVRGIQGKVMISGYSHDLYNQLLDDKKWTRIDMDVYTSAALSHTKANKRRTESLWLNYERPMV